MRTEVPALARGVGILERVCGRPADARALSSALNVPLASLYRILNQLQESGLLRQDSSGRFYPGYGLLRFGYGARMHSHLLETARPVLQQIARATGQMTELTVPSGQSHFMKLEVWLTADAPARLRSRSGQTVEISNRNALGKAYLIFGSPGRLAKQLKQMAATQAERLERQIDKVRRDGFVAMEQNRPPGIARLAVPFFHPSNGELGGTLSVVTEAPRLTRAATVEWAKIIHSHVTAIERALAMDSVG